MLKKALKLVLVLFIVFTTLILSSQALSRYRLNKYNNSVINDEVFHYQDVDSIFNKTRYETIFVFLYDKENDDCVYLDEVLLKDISNDYNGIIFEDIYKIEYERSYQSYVKQLIRNTYHIESFPAIVAIQKGPNDTYTKIDSFEYSSNQEENLKNLEAFLERHHFLEVSKKD